MEKMTINNTPDAAHADTGQPAERLCMGDALAALGRKLGLTEEDCMIIGQVREKTPVRPVRFE